MIKVYPNLTSKIYQVLFLGYIFELISSFLWKITPTVAMIIIYASDSSLSLRFLNPKLNNSTSIFQNFTISASKCTDPSPDTEYLNLKRRVLSNGRHNTKKVLWSLLGKPYVLLHRRQSFMPLLMKQSFSTTTLVVDLRKTREYGSLRKSRE